MSLHKIFLAALLLASTSAAQAKVPPEQMARLDQDLTPLAVSYTHLRAHET